MKCTAIYRTVDPNDDGKSIEKTMDVPLVFLSNGVAKYEAEIEGKAFYSLTETIATGDLLGNLALSPDYTNGVVSRGKPDSDGRFHLARVDGYTVHKMECKKTSFFKPVRLWP